MHLNQSITDRDSEDDMVHYEFTYESHESFEHDKRAMMSEAFEHHELTNSSLGPDQEAKAFLKLIEDVGQPLILVVKNSVNSHSLWKCIILNVCIG